MSATEAENTGLDSGERGMSRRDVAAAAVAAMIAPRRVLGGKGRQAPSDTLAIAGVGVGGMGFTYLRNCESERIVALCDLDFENYALRTVTRYPKAARYSDYREMFDKEKGIDAIIIAAPDHWHAFVQMAALRMRKPIYCAKPLTHTLHELRTVMAAEREAKVVTQLSVQASASEDACSTAEILLSGAIGPVREVHLWTSHPIEPAGQRRPTDTPPVPKGMDWDRWIGPAPYRPYHSAYHPWNWRAWWDFGEGTVGDMACHALIACYEALKLGSPTTVHAYRSLMHEGPMRITAEFVEILPPLVETPESESYANIVIWDFPEREGLPPLRLHWYDGGMRPPRPAGMSLQRPMPSDGSLYVGDKGALLAGFSGGRNRLLPENKFRDYQPPPKTLPRTIGHYREWIEACKGGKPTTCPISLGGGMTEIALLGAIAARTTKVLEWDSKNLTITNDKEANALVKTSYRPGYAL